MMQQLASPQHCSIAVPTGSRKPFQPHLQVDCRHAAALVQCSSSGNHSFDTRSSTTAGLVSRRNALATVGVAGLLAAAAPSCQASLIDEAVAQNVFALGSRSVVSINECRQAGGTGEVCDSVGTGIIWDKYGHVVTNYHIISKYVLDKTGQQVVKVVLDDNSSSSSSDGSGSSSSRSFTASIVGTDALHDLAVLKIDAPAELLVPIRVGTSEDLKVGQSVLALGSSQSAGAKTLTAGIVSGLNRTIPAPTGTRIFGVIQTDALVNASNSGGPLLDSFGRLVGVCTASFLRTSNGRGSGVNFALPVDLVRSVVPNLIITGSASGRE